MLDRGTPVISAARVVLCGLLLALALSPREISAQTVSSFEEVGRFYMRSFAPEDFGGHNQSWDVVQDDEGFLFVANGAGILQYDGVSWRLIRTANRASGRSLALGPDGRIFVGAVAEIGYLAPDPEGQLNYVSLVEHIPEEDRGFSDVWQTHALPDGVYFLSEERLFRWQGGQIEIWSPETEFSRGFAAHGSFYATAGDGELFVLDRDELRLAPGGDRFAGQRIFALVQDASESVLAVTRKHGLVRCHTGSEDQGICKPYAPHLTELLARIEPYCAALLPGEILAIGTRRGGLVLIDRDARLIRVLNEASGLRSDAVWSAYPDRQGGLWLALNDGLTRVEITPSLSFFDQTTGLPETVIHVARHRDRLYAATSQGVSVLEPDAATGSHFVAVPGLSAFCWSLLSTDQGLLAGCEEGVYNLDRQERIWEIPRRSVYSMHRSEHDPEQLYLGVRDGLARLTLEAGRWHDGGRFEAVTDQIRTIAEDDQGRLWLGTRAEGVLRLGAGAKPAGPQTVRRFGVQDGLPVGWLETSTVAGQVRVMLDEGGSLFRFDLETDRFVPDYTFAPRGSSGVKELTEDAQGRVWTVGGEISIVARPESGGDYTLVPTALRRLPNLQPVDIIAETAGPIWVPNARGLVRLDAESVLEPNADYPVWIRRVTAEDGSILYDGPHGRPAEPPAWPFQKNAMRFAFAAPRFDAPEHTRYRTRLEGFDRAATGDGWSAWSTETDKDYTNLWEGRYSFRVQARDVYGIVSREDAFNFQILPPWYRTWWAYGLYCLTLAAVILAFVRSHREELRRERQEAERERVINQRLREVDRIKDEILANTSHELRTPLHGITGLAEALVYGSRGELPEAIKSDLSMISASGHRLASLVDDILDFSKLRDDALELALEPVDLHAVTHAVLTLARPLVGGKHLELINSVPTDLAATADEARLQQVLYNLVGNAVKFTESGRVEVSARTDGSEIELSVTDTGIGISPQNQQRIFESFEQADGSLSRKYGGTGLGLAISRRLIERHGGSLQVKSKIGAGSRFYLTLPQSQEVPVPKAGEFISARLRTAADDSGAVAAWVDDPALASIEREFTLLVVDDEPLIRRVVAGHLRAAGHRVFKASGGAEALHCIESEAVDLVLLDVMMPGMSGYEVCQKVRRNQAREELPIILLSAKDQVEDLVSGFSKGANDYLVKPIGQHELLARVSTHLSLLLVHRQQAQEVKLLEGLLPICFRCKKIRDDQGSWTEIETYVRERSEARFTHGLCPACGEAALKSLEREI